MEAAEQRHGRATTQRPLAALSATTHQNSVRLVVPSSRRLERLAELSLTVEDDLKQKEMVGPLGEVLSAQNVMQTKLSALIEVYKAECDRLQGESV